MHGEYLGKCSKMNDKMGFRVPVLCPKNYGSGVSATSEKYVSYFFSGLVLTLTD